MAYLIGEDTAKWLRAAKRNGADLRSRPRSAPRIVADEGAALVPQWRATIEPDAEDAEAPARLKVDGGWTWVFRSELTEPEGAQEGAEPVLAVYAERHYLEGVDLGPATDRGNVVWRWTFDGPTGGAIAFQPLAESAPEDAFDVVLAAVDTSDSGLTIVRQIHLDTVFFTVPTEPPETPGGGGEGEGGDPEDAPPCGNPLNLDPSDYNPLEDPATGGGGKDPDDYNPLDYPGPGGFTPTCDND